MEGRLDEVEKILPDEVFIRIHKSIIINYEYISIASYDKIQLTTGEVLSISQRYRSIDGILSL